MKRNFLWNENMEYRNVYLSLIFVLVPVKAVPPEACFANFRWDDCGKTPVPVMYYWKPGSRCEVGLWRGCLPNINMFPDEYECVSTCIFSARAMPDDYHSFNKIEEEDINQMDAITDITTTEATNATIDNAGANSTTVAGADGTAADTGATGAGGGGGNSTVAGNVVATTAGGDGAATTEAPAA